MTYPITTWRLLRNPNLIEGARNMAIDEAILRNVAAEKAPPTMRLYAWKPTLTLGRGQAIAEADQNTLRAHNIALVRRPTGGQAVFNTNELTYSVMVSKQEPRFGQDLVESYANLSYAIVDALQRIGVYNAKAERRAKLRAENRQDKSQVCFEVPADYEVTVQGRKLAGHSQMRIRNGILQHGTIPLTGDLGQISVLLHSRPDPNRVRSRTITVRTALGYEVSWETLAQAMVEAFAAILNLHLEPGQLLPHEKSRVEQLLAEKYANPEWTARI